LLTGNITLFSSWNCMLLYLENDKWSHVERDSTVRDTH
jgi:hypothetical protein